jgi:hypothetical protein
MRPPFESRRRRTRPGGKDSSIVVHVDGGSSGRATLDHVAPALRAARATASRGLCRQHRASVARNRRPDSMTNRSQSASRSQPASPFSSSSRWVRARRTPSRTSRRHVAQAFELHLSFNDLAIRTDDSFRPSLQLGNMLEVPGVPEAVRQEDVNRVPPRLRRQVAAYSRSPRFLRTLELRPSPSVLPRS